MKTLSYIQTTPATTWTITHNFGMKPAWDLLLDTNGSRTKGYPQKAEHVDDNTLRLTFTTNKTGAVRLIGV